MKRRDFAIALGSVPLLARPSRAAGAPVEGREYIRLSSPVPLPATGKIELVEFFGYWCPHCAELEPTLQAWLRKQPKDVNFRRVPVAWNASHVPYQRLYFALEALGSGEEIHAKVFQAVHGQGLRLDTDAGLAEFAARNGIDKARLNDMMRSFAIDPKLRGAGQLWKSYQLDGVPALAVDGRYVTSPAQAGGEDRALAVVDVLIGRSRSKGG